MVGAVLCLNLSVYSQLISLKMNDVSVKKAMMELQTKKWFLICVYCWRFGYSEDGNNRC